MINYPDFLILDEAFSQLDSKSKEPLIETIKEENPNYFLAKIIEVREVKVKIEIGKVIP